MADASLPAASLEPPVNLGFAKGLEVAFEAGSRWKGSLVSYLLTGTHQPETPEGPWTLDDCEAFEQAGFPVLIMGCAAVTEPERLTDTGSLSTPFRQSSDLPKRRLGRRSLQAGHWGFTIA